MTSRVKIARRATKKRSRPRSRLRGIGTQGAGSGVPRRGRPPAHAAVCPVAAQPPLQGVTGGKRLVVLVGSRRALAIALHKEKPQRRYSRLAQKLDRTAGN